MNFLAATSLLNFFACSGLAWLVLGRCPQPRLGRAYAIFNASVAFYSLFYTLWQMSVTADVALRFHQWLILGVIWIQQAYLYFIFTVLKMTVEKRPLLWASAVLNIFFTYLNFSGGLYPVVEPRHGFGFWPQPTAWAAVYIVYWHVVCFYGFGLLLWEALHSTGARRSQVGWLAAAYQIGYFGAATNWAMWYGLPMPPYLNCLIVVYVGLIAYAIIRHRLLDIQIIFKRTLVYSTVTAILTLTYIVLAAFLAMVLKAFLPAQLPAVPPIAAAVVVVLFLPLRRHVQEALDRQFFRSDIDRQKALDSLSQKMITADTVEDVSLTFFQVLNQALRPKRMALYLWSAEGGQYKRSLPIGQLEWPETISSTGAWARYFRSDAEPAGPLAEEISRLGVALAFPLKDQELLIGFVFLGERMSEEAYSPEDLRWIQIAVSQASLAFLRGLFFNRQEKVQTSGDLDDVASGLVHEMKTPLANISFPAQAIFAELTAIEEGKRSAKDSIPRLKERIKFIVAQTAKASDRVEAMRDFAAVEDSRKSLVEISEVFQEGLSTLDPLLAAHQIKVQSNFPMHRVSILGQPKQLEIVLVNLMKNAVEAMSTLPLGAVRRLTVTVSNSESQVILEVQDTGLGITPEVSSHIFEKFFTTKGVQGTGVGLHLSKRLVESMGGTMDLQSAPGQGTTFTVRFPAALAAQSHA